MTTSKELKQRIKRKRKEAMNNKNIQKFLLLETYFFLIDFDVEKNEDFNRQYMVKHIMPCEFDKNILLKLSGKELYNYMNAKLRNAYRSLTVNFNENKNSLISDIVYRLTGKVVGKVEY